MTNRLRIPKLKRFPLIAALEVSQRELYLLNYWLQEWPQLVSHQQPFFSAELYRNLHFFPQADLNFVREISNSYMPLLVVKGNHRASHHLPGSVKAKEPVETAFFSDFYAAGGTALWQLPASRQIDLPALPLPELQGEVYLFEDDQQLRNFYRQICYFAGYSLRADFRNEKELILLLEQQANSALCPVLLLINLASERIHAGKFFSSIERFLYHHPHLRSRIRMAFTRDFNLPGDEPHSLAHLARPYARRIFHPREALFVLLEGLLLPRLLGATDGQLEQVLFGEKLQFQPPQPGSSQYRALLPFLWLYEYMNSYCGRGALLSLSKRLKV